MIRKKLRKATSSTSSGIHMQMVGLSLPYSKSCRLIRYHVKEGSVIRVGDLIASCTVESGGPSEVITELRSPFDGTVKTLLVQEDAFFDGATDPVLQIAACSHSAVVEGMCAECGLRMDVAEAAESASAWSRRDAAVVNVEGGLRVEVTRDMALSVREDTVKRLFNQKKLSLVLDLDHTLLHCTDDPRAISMIQNSPPAAHLHTFELDGKLLVLKLRPGLMTFLQAMKERYFEMYVYTAGTRAYAEKVCSIIDPDGTTFRRRIVSRDETPELGAEKDLTRLFPVDDTMVLVVDDRDVWNGVANLITCEPFFYFRGMHDVNNAGWKTAGGEEGSGTGEEQTDGKQAAQKKNPVAEEEADPGLARVESILKQVHGKFFYSKEPVTVQQQLEGRGSDVKVILRDIKLNILRRVVVAVDPEVEPRAQDVSSDRYLETLFAKARACGAVCADQVDHNTTHLIACNETDLAKYGKQRGIWVVRPEWLEKCEHFWQRLKEEPFSVFRTYGSRPRSSQSTTTTSVSSGIESSKLAAKAGATQQTSLEPSPTVVVSEDLDDFAAELGEELMKS